MVVSAIGGYGRGLADFAVAAVLGTEFSLSALAGMLEVPIGDVLPRIREPIDTGLVVDDGSVRFSARGCCHGCAASQSITPLYFGESSSESPVFSLRPQHVPVWVYCMNGPVMPAPERPSR